MENNFHIMFAGASGTGKTTSAKYVEQAHAYTTETEESSIPFISGSVSDLIPKTKEMPHSEMLQRDSKTLQMEDFQIINLRKKLFQQQVEEGNNFVCDRSFLDSAAYFLYKQADKLPKCEVEHFLSLCKQLTSTYCTHLILFDFTPTMVEDWITEDNNKRITNNYFQMEITYIMKMILDLWGIVFDQRIYTLRGGIFKSGTPLQYGAKHYTLETPYGSTEVLVIREVNLEIRNKLIWQFLYGKV